MNLNAYILTFTEGILTFISPCILPMLPIYYIYLAGTSEIDQQAKNKNTLIKNSIAFIIGFSIVFVAMGATVTSLGYFLNNHKDLLRKLSGIVMILFGLNFIGILKLRLLNTKWISNFKFDRLNFGKSLLFGVMFGFGWTPCLGAFLGSALALASNSNTIAQGMLLLLVYSIGLGIPFFITSVAFDKLKGTINNLQRYGRIITIVSGVLLIIAGIAVFTDTLKFINYL